MMPGTPTQWIITIVILGFALIGLVDVLNAAVRVAHGGGL